MVLDLMMRVVGKVLEEGERNGFQCPSHYTFILWFQNE